MMITIVMKREIIKRKRSHPRETRDAQYNCSSPADQDIPEQ